MDEEKLRILKMVEDGKISATDAVSLIEALERSEKRPSTRDLKKKWLHIRVDKDGDRNVDVKIPLALLKFGFKFAPGLTAGGGRHEHHRARAERARERAERQRERAEKLRAKLEAKAEKLKHKMEEKFGPDFDADLDLDLGSTIEEAMEEAFEGVAEGMANGANGVISGIGGIGNIPELGGLDLDRVLEMAAQEGFDGKILEVHDDDDDEHVVITLE